MRLTEALHFYNNRGSANVYTNFEPTKDDRQSRTLYHKRLKEEKRKKKKGMIVDLFASEEE